MARCQAKTKDGKPCKAPATAGGLCYFHANPARARELGRVGGRKNRQQLPEPVVASAISAAELCRVLTEALLDVKSNRLSPRQAAAMSQPAAVLNRTCPLSDLEARLTRLEERMTECAPAVSLEVAPEVATVAAPAEICEEASMPNGSARAEEAEPRSEDGGHSGSDGPEPARE